MHTIIYNGDLLTYEAFLLHIKEYWIAMTVGQIEYIVEVRLYSQLKLAVIPYGMIFGLILVLIGEIIRKLAMITAGKNFTHAILSVEQLRRRGQCNVVTTGIYSFSRHPGYFGWFLWSIGTQLLLSNPVSMITYSVVAWFFFLLQN